MLPKRGARYNGPLLCELKLREHQLRFPIEKILLYQIQYKYTKYNIHNNIQYKYTKYNIHNNIQYTKYKYFFVCELYNNQLIKSFPVSEKIRKYGRHITNKLCIQYF